MRAWQGLWLLWLLAAWSGGAAAAPEPSPGASSALAAARPGPAAARRLLQSGITCANDIPGCALGRCTLRSLNNKQTYVCLRCAPGYTAAKGSGSNILQCICPPGKYETRVKTSRTCTDCGLGAYCPGGSTRATLPADDRGSRVPCNPGGSMGLTTLSQRATAAADCVAMGGYVLPKTVGGLAVACQRSTYSPPNNRLKSCLACQSGLEEPDNFKANGGVRSSKDIVCALPPGAFWESSVTRLCPMGLYRSGYVNVTNRLASKCLNCPIGFTTAALGSQSKAACNRLLPGYKLAAYAPGVEPGLKPQSFDGMDAELCPFGFYFDGSPNVYACQRCPLGSTTLQQGSDSINDCLVPPGYFIRSADGVSGELVKCPNNVSGSGYWRSGWISFSQAVDTTGTSVCNKCGDGILSRPMDDDERLDLDNSTASSDPYFGDVTSSTASCYILGGWGTTVDSSDFTKLKAVAPCPANTYGVAGETFGLVLAPCKACGRNLYSPPGSRNYTECKNPGGFGYSTDGANQCPDDMYAVRDSMGPCMTCADGRITNYVPGNGSWQDSPEDCKVPPGFGVYSAVSPNPWAPQHLSVMLAARPCPVGSFSPGDALDLNPSANPTCQVCPALQSTSVAGSVSCDVCQPGAGGSPGACQLCPHNTYQPGVAQGGDGLSCTACPTTTYNYEGGDTFTSYGITFFTGMSNSYLCTPRFSQASASAGTRLSLPDEVFVHVEAAATISDCLSACPAGSCCIAEFDQITSWCQHAVLPPTPNLVYVASDAPAGAAAGSSARLYYKLPPSDMAAASVKECRNTSDVAESNSTTANGLKAQGVAFGVFATCDMTAWEAAAADGYVGTSPNPALVEAGPNAIEWNVAGQCDSEASCADSCMNEDECWGYIFVPSKGFALRSGDEVLGVRSFFAAPDLAVAGR